MTTTSSRRNSRKYSSATNEKDKLNSKSSKGKRTLSPSRIWSIEQETTLYKAICRFKPAGKHKHFRMISIYQMVNNPSVTSSASPLSMEDIWQKLSTLYDLGGLDDLEDSSEFMADEERLSEDTSAVPYSGSLGGQLGDGTYLQEFYLPWNEFATYIVQQAALPHGTASEESENQESEDEHLSDENSAAQGVSRKRRRSQSADSQPHASEISEVENEESEKQTSASRSKRRGVKKQAATPAPSRTTRTTRQRAAAAAAAAAANTGSKTKSAPAVESNTTNEDDEDTGTEQSEREGSAPTESTNTTTRNNTFGRSKRVTRNTKVSPKAKPTAVPTRRSTRRK